MGGYLGTPAPSPPPAERRPDLPPRPATPRPAQALRQVHRVQHVHRAHPAPRLRPARRPTDWDAGSPAACAGSEAWKRFPMKTPQNSIVGPLRSDWWESYLKRTLWSLRHPRAVWSPVTVTITPRRGDHPTTPPAQVISLAGPAFSEPPPDPRARETVLRALGGCGKARPRREELRAGSPERSRRRKRSPDVRPSAFKPLTGGGDLASFAPSPGPLGSSPGAWGADRGRGGRPSSASVRPRAAGALSPKRNAITSSYSSSRGASESWKRSVRCVSFQMPEWPVKKKTGHQGRPPAPLAPEEARAAPGSPGQPRAAATPLLPLPEARLSPSPQPQRGYTDPAEHRALRTRAGPQQSSKAGKDATEVAADPPLPVALPSAPLTRGAHPQVASPQWRGEGISVAHPASQLGPPTAAVTLLTPASPTPPVSGTTRPPPTWPPGPPATATAVPGAQQAMFGAAGRPARHLSASALPAATSADPPLRPALGPPPSRETEDSSPARIAVAAAASSPLGTFQPVFGSMASLNSAPVTASFSCQPAPHPAPPASIPLGDLVKAAMPTAPASSFKLPVDLGVADVTSTVGNTYSLPSASHTFLHGASRAFRASCTPGTGFIFPPPQPSAIPMGNTANLCSQVLSSAAQTDPSKSTTNFKGKSSPLLASGLEATSQPTLSSGTSTPTLVFTVPLGSSSKPPSPLSLGASPQPALGAAGEQKQGVPPPACGPGFNSSSVFGSSAVASPTPAPAQPAFSGPPQSAFGVLAPPAPALRVPASAPPAGGSIPAGFPPGQARAAASGVATQAHQSGTRGSVFGSTAPRPFAFGGLVTPMDCGESGVSNSSSSSGLLSSRTMPGGAADTVIPCGKGWSQNTWGLSSQSAPFALGRPSVSARKTMFGGPSTVSLAQSVPGPRPVMTGVSFGFGVPSLPAKGSIVGGPFTSSTPSFSIGVKPKTPRNREQGHSRRHHAHKK